MNDDLATRVREVLSEDIGPALHLDGAAIEVVGVDDGVVQLRLGAVCAGCPATLMTVVAGIEQELRLRIPEIEYVEALPLMWTGYITNGFAHHRLEDALEVLAEIGYEGVALTLDHHALNPFDPHLHAQVKDVRAILRRSRMKCVIETGARFLLDRRRKHQPTLLSPEPHLRAYRLEFLERAVYVAVALGAECVSFWSGIADDDAPPDVKMGRLVDGCQALCDIATKAGVRLAFEPEPGMFIDTMARYGELFAAVSHASFGLTADIGHLHCQGEPIAENLVRWKDVLWNIHLEDMRRGVHNHLMFGDGEIDFAAVMHGLDAADYRGGLCVELSRHSHDAVETARKALAFLRAAR